MSILEIGNTVAIISIGCTVIMTIMMIISFRRLKNNDSTNYIDKKIEGSHEELTGIIINKTDIINETLTGIQSSQENLKEFIILKIKSDINEHVIKCQYNKKAS